MAGQAGSALHTEVVLQVFQAKFLCPMDESGQSSDAFRELCTMTNLILHATKAVYSGTEVIAGIESLPAEPLQCSGCFKLPEGSILPAG